MCDYSLELYWSRPATAGERYVLHRFRSGSRGFVDPADCSTAICMPPGARLLLEGLSERLQLAFAVEQSAEVTMMRLPCRGSVYRDGVRFADGREVLLQSLNVGLSAALLPRDLDAMFGLQGHEAPASALARSPVSIAVQARESFSRYVARLRVAGSERFRARVSTRRRLPGPASQLRVSQPADWSGMVRPT